MGDTLLGCRLMKGIILLLGCRLMMVDDTLLGVQVNGRGCHEMIYLSCVLLKTGWEELQ